MRGAIGIRVPLNRGITWWWGFGLLIAAPALLLALFGLRAVHAERLEREEQLRRQQTQAARLADAAIANALDEIEEKSLPFESDLRKRQASVGPSVAEAGGVTSNLPLISFDRRGLLVFHRERVYFGDPEGQAESNLPPTEWSLATESLIEEALASEAQQLPSRAVALYSRILKEEPHLGDWADLCIARIQYRSGSQSARDRLTSPAWGRSQGLTPSGMPVALIACAEVEQLPADERLPFAALLEQAMENLRGGRWWLSYDARRFYDAQLRSLLESAGSNAHATEDVRLDEMAAVERMVRNSPPSRRDGATRSFDQRDGRAFLFLWLPSDDNPDVWTGAAFSERDMASLLDSVLSPLLGDQPYRAAIRGAEGKILWGGLTDQERSPHAEALRSISGWEMVFSLSPYATGTGRAEALWYGLIALLVAVMGFGFAMTVRVVRREAELARRQNEFVAAVSHEFKSPITGIRLLLERVAGGRLGAEENTGEYYAAIGQEIARLDRHVDRLLEAQKIQEGRREYHLAPASIAETARSAIEELRPQAEARDISLDARLESDIPDIQIDKPAITEALENLLDNAIKYSPSGTRITVSVGVADGQVCVEVSDQGIGIEPTDLPRIFDKFYRGRRGDRHSVRGTGLGLALVKATVEAHGGAIEVTSAPGEGSRFSIRLPIENGGSPDG
ncbi:MAG: ATP-binding protein [Blastocatellia bacterium]|nr:ATP-binding protein [Blastocatellia bacterium]